MSYRSPYYRHPRNRLRNNIIGILVALVALVVVLGVGSCTYFSYIKTSHATFTIHRLDDQSNGSSHKYLVFTDKGIFEDTDNIFHAKTDSSDLFNALQVGHKYSCVTSGFRLHFPATNYEDLISCKELR